MSNRDFDQAIRRALAKGRVMEEHACPDHNAMAAYLDGRLDRAERDSLESHAANCSTCRQILGLAAFLDAEPFHATIGSSSSRKKILFRFAVPVSALAMLSAAIAIGVLYLRTYRSPELTRHPSQQAAVQPPIQPIPEPATGISTEAGPVRSAQNRPSASAKEAPKPEPELKQKATAPPAEPGIAGIPAGDTAAPAAVLETAEISSVKSENRRLAAARVAPAAPASEAAGAGRFAGVKDSEDRMVGGVVGGVVGGIARPPEPADLSKVAALNMVRPEPTPRDAILESTRHQGDAVRWKRIGERGFRYAGGYWIDDECAKNSNAPIVEIRAGLPEFEEIVAQYPELRTLLPAVVLRNGKIWVLR